MTGHIRKRGERSSAVLVDLPRGPDGKRRRKWHTVHGNKKDAQRKRNGLLHEIETGAYVEPARMTVKEYLTKWLSSRGSKVGAKTLERYQQLAEAPNRTIMIEAAPVIAIRGGPITQM